MIELVFEFLNDLFKVRIEGNNVFFSNGNNFNQFTTIEGLRLSQAGVIKQFPDLKDDVNWKIKAIDRFNFKIKSLNSEEKIAEYIIKDLEKYGYALKNILKKELRVKNEK